MVGKAIAASALLALLSVSPAAAGYSDQADIKASCNASFHEGCIASTDLTQDPTVLESPLPSIAGSPVALILLAASLYILRHRRAVA